MNDGIFHMNVKDYRARFFVTFVNINNEKMHYDYFLKLNDNSEPSGRSMYCGKDCTRHHLTVVSPIEQEVWITAHTWEDRDYPEKCKPDDSEEVPKANMI